MAVFVIDGTTGSIVTGRLPSGDLTLKGSGEDRFVSQARALALAAGGRWDDQYGNWIVPSAKRQQVYEQLDKGYRQIG